MENIVAFVKTVIALVNAMINVAKNVTAYTSEDEFLEDVQSTCDDVTTELSAMVEAIVTFGSNYFAAKEAEEAETAAIIEDAEDAFADEASLNAELSAVESSQPMQPNMVECSDEELDNYLLNLKNWKNSLREISISIQERAQEFFEAHTLLGIGVKIAKAEIEEASEKIVEEVIKPSIKIIQKGLTLNELAGELFVVNIGEEKVTKFGKTYKPVTTSDDDFRVFKFSLTQQAGKDLAPGKYKVLRWFADGDEKVVITAVEPFYTVADLCR